MHFRKSMLLLSLIGCLFLYSSAFAQWSGDFSYTVSQAPSGMYVATITGYIGSSIYVYVPSQIDYMPVVSIGPTAFMGYTKMTGIDIPSSITSIGIFAFGGCTGLTSVTIPSSITSIGYGAFCDCTGLGSISIPASVTSIEREAFSGCSGLTDAYFYGNAPTMGSDVFRNCASGFTVYYLSGATGFTNPWYGYPAVVFDPNSTTTTTSIGPSTTTTTVASTTTTVFVDVDTDGDGKFDYIQAGCSNLDGDCDYNDAAADGNQIAMMNNDGTSTFLKTYADIGFNAVTPAFHPVRTETRNYCTNLSWGGIDTWQPLDEHDIWKLVSANHPFDAACNSYDWGCYVFSTAWSSKTSWVAPPAPWNAKLTLNMEINYWYRNWIIRMEGCAASDANWFIVDSSDIYKYSKFETDPRWPNARPMVICKAIVTTSTTTTSTPDDTTTSTTTSIVDTDGDGVADASDNCPSHCQPPAA